jgi:hypothetical protein
MFLRVRSEAEHIAIRILNLHFECPGPVRRLLPDDGTAILVSAVQSANVANAHPDPGSNMALAASAQVDAPAIPPDVRKVVRPPCCLLEAEYVNEVANADRHVFDPEDRIDAFKARW